MKKKITAFGVAACMCVACVPFAACGEKDDGKAAAFVSMDINPSIELTLDKNNKVISVYGSNEDGQVLLYGENGIVGENVEVAVEKITALAVELGYLNDDNKVVETSVTATGKAEELLSKINAKITATAGESNLEVSCTSAQAYSLMRKLESLKAQYPDNAAIQALTPEKLKVVLSVTESGEITLESALQLSDEELLNYVADAHKKATEFATSAYNKAKSAAEGVYEKAVGAATDGIYTSYYMVHHPLSAYNGLAYQGFKTTARAMTVLSDTLFYVEKASEYPLDEAQISAVSAALGLGTDISAIKNSDGEVTVKSIEAYADKQFKNSEASKELENLKTELNKALDGIDSQLREKIAEISSEYADELNSVKENLNGIVSSLEKLIPANVNSQITAIVNDFKDITAEIVKMAEDGRITSEEVKALALKLEEKSAAALKQIEDDLTEEELAEVKELQQKAIQGLEKAKQQCDAAVAKAESEAKAKLETLKASRKAN